MLCVCFRSDQRDPRNSLSATILKKEGEKAKKRLGVSTEVCSLTFW